MRSLLAILSLLAALTATAAQAEKRIFIISGNADGYGVDRCLADGSHCGSAAASAYCKSHEFAEAMSYRKVDRDDITGAIPTGGSGGCQGNKCDVVAIVCTR
jgi:hypothetical protein